jgi:desulfoferrodoxin (superoxide reductase-like protein)
MGKKKPENIVLKHVDVVNLDHPDGDNTFSIRDGHVEFFMDEHDLQWIKFTPSNGYHAGQEHCVPRERIIAVVYEKRKSEPKAVQEIRVT